MKAMLNSGVNLCDNDSSFLCENCKLETFCHKDELKEHLKYCENIKFSKNKILGRHLVANRNIKYGEIIFKEAPKLIGPKSMANAICFNCFQSANHDESLASCRKCNIVPICADNYNCSGVGHSKKECEFFEKQLQNNLNLNFLLENFQISSVLKFLALKVVEPTVWDQLYSLESHFDARRNIQSTWIFYDIYFTKVIEKCNILSQKEIDNNLVQKLCGILDVNSFELRVPSKLSTNSLTKSIRGLYLKPSFISHECIGNVMISTDDDYMMIIRAKKNINKNEPLFFNYGDFLKNTQQRQEFIKEGKYFDCKCRRCLDPTEMSTFLSSIKCPKCKIGLLLQLNMSDNNSNWKCNNKGCQKLCKACLIETTINQAEDLVQNINKSNTDDVENLLRKLQRTLSNNHSLLMELKQILINLYSMKIANDKNPSHVDISREIELLNNILFITEKLDPNNTRFKGLNMYQIHIPLVMKANKSYSEKRINVSKLYDSLLEAEKYLKKSIEYLLFEPKNSVEGRLVNTALSELHILRNSIEKIQKLKK